MTRRIKTIAYPQAAMQRRLFLKAIALGLSAPLAYQLVRSATAQTSGGLKRFMLYFMPHGVPLEHFHPVGESTDFAMDQSGVSVLGPLEKYKSLVNVYEGFHYPQADTHEAVNRFLSGSDAAPSDISSPRVTIDQFIGNELDSPTLSLGALPQANFGLEKDGMLMWDGGPITPQISPLKAYDEAFANLGNDDGGDSVNDELYQSLLTLTESQVAGLQKDVSSLTSEQSKLQTHLNSIQSLKESAGGGSVGCTTAPVLEAVETLRAAAAGQDELWFVQHENFPVILEAHLEVAAASIVCGSRPIVSLQSMYTNMELNFGFMGEDNTHHSGLSHTGPQIGSGVADMTVRESFANAQRWFIEQLADKVLDKLDVDDPTDPGRTVLDNTIVLITSEIGDGADHTTFSKDILRGPPPGLMSYLPIVTIGGGGGGLKTGQRLNYHTGGDDGSGDRPASDVWLTIAQAMGINATSFGDSEASITEALA